MLGEFGEGAKILAGGQSLVPMLAMRLTYFENLIDISRVDQLKNIELRNERGVDRCGHSARAGGHGRRGGRLGAAADVVDSVHRPLPDPHAGHAGRSDRARRPRRGVRRGGARTGRDDGGDVVARQSADSGVGVLHRLVGDVVGVRRDPDRGAVPGVGRPIGVRDRGVRPPPRRFRDRRGRRRGGARRFRPMCAAAVSACSGLGSTPLRGSAAEEGVIGRPVAGLAADEIGRLAMSGSSRHSWPIYRVRPTTAPGWVRRWWHGPGLERFGRRRRRRRFMHELPVHVSVNGRTQQGLVEPR